MVISQGFKKIIYAVMAIVMVDITYLYVMKINRSMTISIAAWLVLGIAFSALLMKSERLDERVARRAIPGIVGVVVCVQLFLVGYVFRHHLPAIDALSVYAQAMAMAGQPHPQVASMDGYFGMYGNNYPWLLILFGVLRLIIRLVPDISTQGCWIIVLLVNTLAIDAGIVCALRIVSKVLGTRGGLIAAFLFLVNPVTYLLIPYVYTTSVSIPFFIGIFAAELRIKEADSIGKTIMWSGIQAILTIVGYEIRPTVFIAFIAVLICRGLSILTKKKKELKKHVAMLVCFVIIFGAGGVTARRVVNSYVPETVRAENFPMAHWIMMGLGTNGGWNQKDVDFTASFRTKEEKQAADINVIKDRVKYLTTQGIGSIAGFLYTKFKWTWHSHWIMDGLSIEIFDHVRDCGIEDLFSGFRNKWLTTWFNSYKALLFAFCAVEMISRLFRKKKESEETDRFLYTLALFGFVLFCMIWEANIRYSLCVNTLLVVIASFGIETLTYRLPESKRMITGCRIAVPAMIIVIVLISVKKVMYISPVASENITYQIRIPYRDTHAKNAGRVLEKKDVLTQTFQADKVFNCAEICLFDISDKENSGNGSYLVRIIDQNGKVLASREIKRDEVQDEGFYSLSFENIIPDGVSEYKLEISSAGEEEIPDWAQIVSYEFEGYDYYPYGELERNGRPTGGDLAFRVGYIAK